MKQLMAAALAAGFLISFSNVPASAQAGSAIGLIVHASIVSRCENRELTKEEAQRSALFAGGGIWKAWRECLNRQQQQKK